MKKIGIVSSTDKIGGTEISALRICNLLAEKGNEVVYIAPGNMLQNEMTEIKFIPYKLSRRNPILMISAIFSIARIIKNEHIDVVHCQDAMSCILCCYAKKYLGSKVRIVWHERGIHYKSYTTMAQKYSPIIDVIICNSCYERTLLMMNRCDPAKIRVIYNAIEKQIPTKGRDVIRNEIGILPDDFVVGSVGRLTWDKGFITLLAAAALVQKNIMNLKVLLVGDGPERINLEKYANELGISDRVIFVGFRRDIPNMLTAMDIFVIPSWYEAFGNVTVEAMLAKTPVIASRVGGIPEVVQDGVNGFLVPSADERKLADAILSVYQKYGNIGEMVERAYSDACEKYNFEKYYNLITNAYFGMDLN